MAQANVVARVVFITGEAYARDKSGQMRRLEVGDGLLEGETVVTRQGAQVQLALEDGRDMVLRANESVQLDAEVAAALKPDARDSALADGMAGVDKVIQALNEGGDLDAVLEDPAAGVVAAGGEGHSFVQLLRIVETIDPIDFRYATGDDGVQDEIGRVGEQATLLAGEEPEPAPEAHAADSASAPEDGVAAGNVLANDDNADGGLAVDSFTIAGISHTAGATATLPGIGTLTIAANGDYVFTPAPDWNGTVPQIAYTTTSGAGSTLDITVTPVNDAPLANADANAITERVDDPTGSSVSGNVVTAASAGDVADADIDSATLQVTGVRFGATEYAAGSAIALAYGTLTVNADGSYTYTLDNADPTVNALNVGDSLSEQVVYTLSDGDKTATATLTITIDGANDSPTATVGAPIVGAEDGSIQVPLTGTDPDSPIAYVTVTALPLPGVGVLLKPDGTPAVAGEPIAVDPASGQVLLTFVPAPDFNGGPVNIPFTVTDADGRTSPEAVQQVSVTPVNDAPVDGDESRTVSEDQTLAVGAAEGLLANLADVDGGAPSVTGYTIAGIAGSQSVGAAVAIPGVGSLTINADGSYAFTPAPDYAGAIPAITYTVSDGAGGTDTSVLTLTLAPVDDASALVADADTTPEDVAATGNVLANDADVDNALSVASFGVAGVAGSFAAGQTAAIAGVGTITLAANGDYVFTPAANWNGAVPTVTYTTNTGSSSTLAITVTPLDDTPSISDDTATTPEDTPVTLAVLANDSDVDGDPLSVVAIAGQPVAAGGSVALANGTATLNADGTITFTPAPDYHGAVSFTYTASDGTTPVSADVNITVTPVNDLPVAVNDKLTTPEETPVTILVRNNDSDADGDPLTVTAFTQPGHGTVSLNADGNPVYTPDLDYVGADSFTYTVGDGQGGTATATVSIDVGGINDAPVANPDSNATSQDATLTVTAADGVIRGAAGADTDLDGDSLAVTGVAFGATPGAVGTPLAGAWGSLTLHADGSYSYVPNAAAQGVDEGESRTDIFSYTVADPGGLASTTTLSLTVTGANDGPVAVDDSATTPEDTPVTIAVLNNDGDVDGEAISVVAIAGQPVGAGGIVAVANGSVMLNADGTLTFTPAAGYNGAAAFTYTVSDGTATATATVNLVVDSVNDPPLAQDNLVAGFEDTPVSFDPRSNDADPDGDALTITAIDGQPIDAATPVTLADGVVAMNADGTLTFTPNADFHGDVIFGYTISDGRGGSDTAQVTLSIAAVNDLPLAVDDAVTTAEDTPVTIAVRANDSDPEGNPLTVTAVTQGSHGSVSIDAATGNPVYTPDADWNGSDTFTYTVSDGQGGSDTATVTVGVAPVNDAPVNVVPAAVTVDEDTTYVIRIGSYGVSDVDGDVLTATVTVEHGAVTLGSTAGVAVSGNGSGALTITGTAAAINAAIDGSLYVPGPDYNGPASVTIATSDGSLIDTDVIPVTVRPVADIAGDAVTTPEDTPVTIAVLDNDSFESAGRTITAVNGQAIAEGGSVATAEGSVALAGGQLVFTPAPNYHGPASFTYTVTAGGVTETAGVDVTVTSVNDAPVAIDDSVSTAEDTPITVAVRDNDSDADGGTLSVVAVTQGANGTVAIDPLTGNPVYAPNANFNGSDSFTYTIADGQGGSATATVTVTVNAVNDLPVAADDTAFTPEDTPVLIPVRVNDADNDGDALTVTAVTPPVNGTVVIDPVSGNLLYTPAADFAGNDSFTYTVSDGQGGTDTATVTVVVGGTNDNPVARDDTATTDEDAAVTIAVRSNDFDQEGDPLTVTGVTQSAHGTVAIDPVSGNPVYTPNANWSGTDTFTYTVSDGQGGSDTATVTVTVNPVNDAPLAVDDAVTTAEDAPVTIAVRGNDTDSENDPLTVTAVTQGANGTVAIDPVTGNPVYTPNANFNGSDSFTYTVSDGQGGSDTATVSVTVNPVNDAPLAADDAVTTAEDTPVTVAVRSNDSDPEGNPLSVVAVTAGAHGSVAIDPVSGNPVYTPDANWSGSDSFTYTISDGNGGFATATVSVTVTAVNDAPLAVDDVVATPEDTPVTIAVRGNDSDPEGNPLTVTGVTQGAHGTVAIDPVSGNPVYTPAADYTGPDSFTYTISDGQGGSDTATVTVNVGAVNDAPVAADDSVVTSEDTPVAIAVRTNDGDAENDPLTVTAVTQGSHGSVAIDPVSGNPVYTPNANWNGSDSFTYTISDGVGGTATATVNVTVNAVNDLPVAVDDNVSTSEDTPVAIAVRGNDSDADGDALTVTAVTQGANGTVAIDPVTGNPVYTPNPDWNGSDAFTYTVSDGHGGTATATVTVTVAAVNDLPRALADEVDTVEDTPIVIAVRGNDSDPDGDPLTVTAVTQGANGAVAIDPVTGNPVYTPNANFAGTDTFTYTIGDGQGGSATATVTVHVNPVNDAPVANADAVSTSEDVPVIVAVRSNDSDVENDPLTVVAVTQGAHGSVAIDPLTGNPVYTPQANWSGSDSFTYTISDGQGGSATATVTVTVNPVNDAPLANPDAYVTAEDTPLTFDPRVNDTDIDGPALAVTAVAGQPIAVGSPVSLAAGTVSLNGDGTLTFTPALDFNGPVNFTYTASDGTTPVSSTVSIDVTPVNDAPVAVADSVATPLNVPVTVAVRGNDSDVDGDALTVSAVTQGANGTVTIDPVSGNPVYTPANNFSGQDSFTYTVSDGQGGFATTTVTVDVGANTSPAAVADSNATDQNTALVVDAAGGVLTNDSDPDAGAALTVQSVALGGTSAAAGSGLAGAYGTLTLAGDGSYTYVPNAVAAALGAGQSAQDVFTYTVGDGQGGTATATLTINVAGSNDGPVAVADSNTVGEDAAGASGDVTPGTAGQDSDPDAGDVLDVIGVAAGTPATAPTTGVGVAIAGTYGSVVVQADGSYAYTPGAAAQALVSGQTGIDTFTYTIADGQGGQASATLTISVAGADDAPLIGGPLTGAVTEDGTTVATGTLTIVDPDAGQANFVAQSGVAGTYGSFDLSSAGVWTYTLDNAAANVQALAQGEVLSESFAIATADGTTRTVTVTVNGSNDAPVAVADNGIVAEDATLAVPVLTGLLANDTDVDAGDGKSVSLISQGAGSAAVASGTPGVLTSAYGTLTVNADGSYSYVADGAASQALKAGTTATDTFTYTLQDSAGATSTATLTLTVAGTNDAPLAVADAGSVMEDATLTVPAAAGLLVNDTDVDAGDGKSVALISQGAASATVASGTPGVLVSVYGTLTVNADGSYSYVANGAASQALKAGATATDTFAYTMRDSSGATSATALVITITGSNDAPVVGAGSARVSEEGLAGGIADSTGNTDLTNARIVSGSIAIADVDGDALAVTLTAPATPLASNGVALAWSGNGTAASPLVGSAGGVEIVRAVIGSGGSYTVTLSGPLDHAVTGQEDTLSFALGVRVDDGSVVSSNTLTVTVEDDAPVAVSDSANVNIAASVTGNVLATDNIGADGHGKVVGVTHNGVTYTDTNGDGTIVVDTANGLLSINADGSYTYTSQLAASVGGSGLATAWTNAGVYAFKENPTGGESHFFVPSGSGFVAPATLNLANPSGAVAFGDANGLGVLGGTGNSGYINSDTNEPEVLVIDLQHGVAGATLTLFSGTNQQNNSGNNGEVYWVAYDSNMQKVGEGSQAVSSKLFNVSVNPGGEVRYIAVFTHGADNDGVKILVNGVSGIDYANPNDSFTYHMVDADGDPSSAALNINALESGDLIPDALADSYATSEDTPLVTGDVLANDLAGNGAKTVTGFDAASLGGGTVLYNGNGTFTYTPAANFNGTDSFTYTISDADGDSDTATVTVTVAAVNDVPVVSGATAGVSEEGLAGGLADAGGSPSDTTDASTASGSLGIVDPDHASFAISLTAPATSLTSGGVAVTWSGGSAGTDLVGSAGGNEVIRVSVDDIGNYTVALSGPIDHAAGNGENVASFSVGVSVSDGTATTASSLVINVEDDAPATQPSSHAVVLPYMDTNLLIVLDVSGSMSTTDGPGGITRLQAAKNAINQLLDQYDNFGDVKVQLVTFSSSTNTPSSSWMTVAAAKTAVNNASANGGTNYDYALTAAQSAFVTSGKIVGAQNVSYFFSDGDPTLSSAYPSSYSNPGSQTNPDLGDGIDVTEEAAWKAFLNNNGIMSHAIGLGGSVATTYLEPVAYNGSNNTENPAQVVTDLAQLTDTLRDTIVPPSVGDLLTGGVIVAGVGMGADGGTLQSLTVNGTTYTYDPAAGGSVSVAGTDRGVFDTAENTLTIATTLGGKLVVDLDTGEYRYTAPPTITAQQQESIAYTVRDLDGDSAGSTLTINITPPQTVTLTGSKSTLTGINLGLSGEYFGYNDNRDGTPADPLYSGGTRLHADDGTADAGAANNVDRLADVEAIIEGRNGNPDLIGNAVLSTPNAADATFSANKLEFGLQAGTNNPLFANDLGQNNVVTAGTTINSAFGGNRLYTFLRGSNSGNADSLVATSGLGDSTDGIIRMVGYIYMPAGGSYDLRITADDGYRVLIGGQNVAQLDQIQETTTNVYTGKVIAEGLQPIEILYWDQGGNATFRVEVKPTGSGDSNYKIIGTDEYALFSPGDVPTLAANQEIAETSTNGTWEIRTGEDYTGSAAGEKIVGSDGPDTIRAAAGNDVVVGGAGADTLEGGQGNDALTGGLGSDTFAWTLGDQGAAGTPARDTIADFNAATKAAGGDVLDLRDLLQGENSGNLVNYLHFSKSGSDTVIDVKHEGSGGAVTQQIVLAGVDLTANSSLGDQAIIQDLLSKGKLLTE